MSNREVIIAFDSDITDAPPLAKPKVFDDVNQSRAVNLERKRYIERKTIQAVIEACPDA